MKTETRSEQFHPPSFIGNILRKLHIDIPLFIGLLLISLLSFVILYSAG
ncbi:MAG: rod shape-determining protein RodA, partial [Methylobacter sp.]